MKKTFVLVVLDGWGVGKNWGGNAILVANTPNYNRLLREFPNTTIAASGSAVGLPGHEMGNSEVGHMNLGAGQVVIQDSSQINKAIANGSFYKNKVLNQTIKNSKDNFTTLHLVGIVSDGGIHSHITHLLALLKLASNIGHKDVLIHAFTDGRDTDPLKGIEFINKLEYACEKLNCGKIATITGRSFLDRKGNWERTKTVYNAIVDGVGIIESNSRSAVSNAYRSGQTDEYILPRIIRGNFHKAADKDSFIFFNFRSDRTKQLTQAFLDPKLPQIKKRRILSDITFITFIPYGTETEIQTRAIPAFETVKVNNTLSSYVSSLGLTQFHLAETEKFAHVTYFFNGNKNEPFKGEERFLVPSPDVSSYAQKPEMSSDQVTSQLIKAIRSKRFHFILCNYANGDMVGHTGDFKAAVEAVAAIDYHLKKVVATCQNEEVDLLITADHGNIEQMIDPETGQPDTEHTRNPVPLIYVSNNHQEPLTEGGKLGNVASTLLDISGYSIPKYFLSSLLDKSNKN